jgi:hypothetical protein
MRIERVGLALVLAAGLAGCAAENQAATEGQAATAGEILKGGSDETGEYVAYENWWKPAADHTDPAACPGAGRGGGGGGAPAGGGRGGAAGRAGGGGRGGQANPGPCWVWGEVSGASADNPNRIIVAVWGDRDQVTGEGRPGGSNYVVEVDGNGNIIKNWTKWDSLFNTPHQVYISPYDPERAIYIVERGGRQPGPNGVDVHEAVYKFSNDGETLIWKLVDPASKMSGQEQRAMTNLQPTDFGDPSVLTFLPDGRHFLLADGYQNGRIQKWTTDGEWVSEFGMIDRDPAVGGPPGSFDLLHGIAVDRAGRIYVGDRNNSRIQLFTSEGEFIEEWPGVIDPVGIYVDESDAVWVVSAALNRMLKYNTEGQLLYHWGTYGRTAGGFVGGHARPHEVDVDQDGNVYITSWDWPGYLSKFTPKPGADPAKLIGQKLGTRN